MPAARELAPLPSVSRSSRTTRRARALAGTRRTRRRSSLRRRRRRPRSPAGCTAGHSSPRWHRLNSQSRIATSQRSAERRPRYHVRPHAQTTSRCRPRARAFTDELIPYEVEAEMNDGELPEGIVEKHEARADPARPVRHQHPARAGRPGMHHAAAGARPGAGRPGHQRPRPGAWRLPRPGGPRSPPTTSARRWLLPTVAARWRECYAITEEFAGSDVAAPEGHRRARRRRLRPQRREVARDVVQRGRLRVLPGRAHRRAPTPASTACSSSTSHPRHPRGADSGVHAHLQPPPPDRRLRGRPGAGVAPVGIEGDGMSFVYEWFRFERLMIAARCLGAADRLVDEMHGVRARAGSSTASRRSSGSSCRACSPTA